MLSLSTVLCLLRLNVAMKIHTRIDYGPLRDRLARADDSSSNVPDSRLSFAKHRAVISDQIGQLVGEITLKYKRSKHQCADGKTVTARDTTFTVIMDTGSNELVLNSDRCTECICSSDYRSISDVGTSTCPTDFTPHNITFPCNSWEAEVETKHNISGIGFVSGSLRGYFLSLSDVGHGGVDIAIDETTISKEMNTRIFVVESPDMGFQRMWSRIAADGVFGLAGHLSSHADKSEAEGTSNILDNLYRHLSMYGRNFRPHMAFSLKARRNPEGDGLLYSLSDQKISNMTAFPGMVNLGVNVEQKCNASMKFFQIAPTVVAGDTRIRALSKPNMCFALDPEDTLILANCSTSYNSFHLSQSAFHKGGSQKSFIYVSGRKSTCLKVKEGTIVTTDECGTDGTEFTLTLDANWPQSMKIAWGNHTCLQTVENKAITTAPCADGIDFFFVTKATDLRMHHKCLHPSISAVTLGECTPEDFTGSFVLPPSHEGQIRVLLDDGDNWCLGLATDGEWKAVQKRRGESYQSFAMRQQKAPKKRMRLSVVKCKVAASATVEVNPKNGLVKILFGGQCIKADTTANIPVLSLSNACDEWKTVGFQVDHPCTSSGHPEKQRCKDGALVDFDRNFLCLKNDHGGREQCPDQIPFKCNNATGCANGTEPCCRGSAVGGHGCDHEGGVAGGCSDGHWRITGALSIGHCDDSEEDTAPCHKDISVVFDTGSTSLMVPHSLYLMLGAYIASLEENDSSMIEEPPRQWGPNLGGGLKDPTLFRVIGTKDDVYSELNKLPNFHFKVKDVEGDTHELIVGPLHYAYCVETEHQPSFEGVPIGGSGGDTGNASSSGNVSSPGRVSNHTMMTLNATKTDAAVADTQNVETWPFARPEKSHKLFSPLFTSSTEDESKSPPSAAGTTAESARTTKNSAADETLPTWTCGVFVASAQEMELKSSDAIFGLPAFLGRDVGFLHVEDAERAAYMKDKIGLCLDGNCCEPFDNGI